MTEISDRKAAVGKELQDRVDDTHVQPLVGLREDVTRLQILLRRKLVQTIRPEGLGHQRRKAVLWREALG